MLIDLRLTCKSAKRLNVYASHYKVLFPVSLCPGSLQVTGCPHQKKDECDIQVVRSPVNVSSTITVRSGRIQHRAHFRCEAQLALEQQPPLPMMSHGLSFRVLCEYCGVKCVCVCVCVCVWLCVWLWLWVWVCGCECKQGFE